MAEQGFAPVRPEQGSEVPPALAGATLSCLEVPLVAHRPLEATSETCTQHFGLYLFGGDDVNSHQTDALLVYHLQTNKWRTPQINGQSPSKRSWHTASVIYHAHKRQQLLLIFGGVGATNAISLLDTNHSKWLHPPACSTSGDTEKTKRRSSKTKPDEKAHSHSLFPCARFGHSAAVFKHQIIIFGGTDFRGSLGDLFVLDIAADPMEWSCPLTTGFAPPPSSKHCCATFRGHMLVISGERTWGGHLWALRLQPDPVWFRSTLPDFPLMGSSWFAVQPYMSPHPNHRAEILIFGGHLEATGGEDSEVLDAFFTLDLRSWRHEEAEVPREVWPDVEKRLRAAGVDDADVGQARADWEEEQKRRQKEIHRANRRKMRRRQLREDYAHRSDAPSAGAGASDGGISSHQELSDDDAVAALDKEFELPPEVMPTITFGSWVPLRVGRRLPPPRFGHAMAMAGSAAYIFGGRNRSRSDPLMNDMYYFDCKPLAWKAVTYCGDSPGKRVSHSMTCLDHFLYVLGGGGGNRSFNDLHRLDLSTMRWELIHTRGAVPGAKPDALIGHSVVWVDPYLIVFGGGNGRRPSHDLHTLELRSTTWRHIETNGAPPAPRVGHSCTLLGRELFVVSGFSRGKYFHDAHVLHVETLAWTQAVTTGTPPRGRVSHTATLYNGRIHIFGGSAGGQCFNDYLILSPTPLLQPSQASAAFTTSIVAGCSTLSSSGTPVPRSTGCMTARWNAPEVTGFPPEPRYSHTSTLVGSMLFIVGGLARKGKPHDDVHVLDLSELTWSLPRLTHEGPAPRGRHTTVSVGSTLVLFGGGAQGLLFEDMWMLDVDGKGFDDLQQVATQHALDDETPEADAGIIPVSFLTPHRGVVSTPSADVENENHEARDASTDEVCLWLTHLGMSQHAYAFAAHEIDFQLLLQLQDHDLIDMHIDDATQRFRLLNGIDLLREGGPRETVGRKPRERLFQQRYLLGTEVNFGGHPAILAVDCKTNLKVVVKFVPRMLDYQRQGVCTRRMHHICMAVRPPYISMPWLWITVLAAAPVLMLTCLIQAACALRCSRVTVALHKQLKSAFVARLADSYATPHSPPLRMGNSLQGGLGPHCLVLEYGEHSMADSMSSGLMSSVHLKASFEAILQAVVALHELGYAHCALQPESFRLYDGGAGWRLATLDSATHLGEPAPAKCPVCYAAPEVVNRLRNPGTQLSTQSIATAPASTAMDVWSLGVLLWQLFSQQPLVGNEVEALAVLPALRSVELNLGCVSDLQARHLLCKMLHHDASKRIWAQAILQHSYVTGGLDTVQIESTFLPMQKGQLFVRSLLHAINSFAGKKCRAI